MPESSGWLGVVDVDFVCFGDPLYTAALTKVAGRQPTDYVDGWLEHWGATAADEDAFNFHCAVFCLDLLSEQGQMFNDDQPLLLEPERPIACWNYLGTFRNRKQRRAVRWVAFGTMMRCRSRGRAEGGSRPSPRSRARPTVGLCPLPYAPRPALIMTKRSTSGELPMRHAGCLLQSLASAESARSSPTLRPFSSWRPFTGGSSACCWPSLG